MTVRFQNWLLQKKKKFCLRCETSKYLNTVLFTPWFSPSSYFSKRTPHPWRLKACKMIITREFTGSTLLHKKLVSYSEISLVSSTNNYRSRYISWKLRILFWFKCDCIFLRLNLIMSYLQVLAVESPLLFSEEGSAPTRNQDIINDLPFEPQDPSKFYRLRLDPESIVRA